MNNNNAKIQYKKQYELILNFPDSFNIEKYNYI